MGSTADRIRVGCMEGKHLMPWNSLLPLLLWGWGLDQTWSFYRATPGSELRGPYAVLGTRTRARHTQGKYPAFYFIILPAPYLTFKQQSTLTSWLISSTCVLIKTESKVSYAKQVLYCSSLLPFFLFFCQEGLMGRAESTSSPSGSLVVVLHLEQALFCTSSSVNI